MKMRKMVAALLAVLMLCSIIPFSVAAESASATIDFTDKANRTYYSTEQQVWEQNGITVTNDKGASTSNVGDYGGDGYPARFYKSSTVTIEYPGMTKIVIDCTGLEAKYVTGWSNSFSADATATSDGNIVTITLAEAANSFTWEQLSAQSRAYNITVYGEGGAPVNPPVDPEVPPVEPDQPDTPVEPASSANIDFTDIANRVSYTTSQQVWAQNGITVTNDKGASTSNVGDYGGNGYPARFYKSSTVTIEYPGMTKIVIDCTGLEAKYVTGWSDSFSADATATTDGGIVTITLAEAVNSFTWEQLSAQSRANSITVYTGEGGDTPVVPPVDPEVPSDDPEADTELTIAEAIALALSKEHNVYTEGKYFVTGVITEVYNTQYGNMRLTDEAGNILTIYGTYSADGADRYDAMAVKPVAGDTVTIYGIVGQYNGAPQIKNGWIVEHTAAGGETPDVPVVPPVGDTLTIEEAIALGLSQAHNVYTADKYYVTGVITEVYNDMYGNMRLTDEAGNILTIYGTYSADGSTRYDAMAVKPVAGDTVTIYGVVGQYNGDPQIKNGWIVEHIPAGGETPDVPVEPPVSDEIETDYPFLFGMTQYNVSEEDVYFLAGGMDGYYMATTTNPDEAIVVYVEATDGGYYFYTYDGNTKLYINMVVSGTHVNGAYEATASTVYRYDADYGTLIANVNGADYWFGTRNDNTYTTVGPCKVEYEGFYCEFYYFSEEEECEHEYDNDCDDECNLCGELREVGEHVYDDEYDADCNICGDVREVPEKPVYVGGIAAGTNMGAIGEKVSIGVQVDGNPGIVSVKVKVHFDNTALKLVEAAPGEFSAAGYSWGDIDAANEKGYFIVNWCDATRPNSTAQMLATLTFEILESAQVGEMYEIYPEFNCQADIFNAADETVWFYAVTGSVIVKEKASVIEGDADGNGKVNNRDLALLQQHINGWDVEVDVDAADVDGNDKINNRDLALLQQYINGWDVELI